MTTRSHDSVPRILVVEDVDVVFLMYKELLGDEYFVKICTNEQDTEAVINEGSKFDLAIIDLLLPVSESRPLPHQDAQSTGLRLMEALIEKDICHRFYVITVLKDAKAQVEQLCRGRATLRFEYKLDNDPADFVHNVVDLLGLSIDVSRQRLLLELNTDLKKIKQSCKDIKHLARGEKGSLMAFLPWVERVLHECRDPAVFRRLFPNDGIKREWCKLFRQIRTVLVDRLQDTTGALHDMIETLIIALTKFLDDYCRGPAEM